MPINPNIVDLSDNNRPTKLAEVFGEIYDNEWTDASEFFDAEWKTNHIFDAQAHHSVDKLLHILKVMCKCALNKCTLYMEHVIL